MSTTITSDSSATASQYAALLDSNEPSSSPATPTTVTSVHPSLSLDFPTLGDPMAEIAALLAMSFQEDRKHAKRLLDLEEASRLREGEMRIEAMHQKADEIVPKVGPGDSRSPAGAGCSAAGGIMSLTANDSHKGDALLSLWSGGSKGFHACGTIAGSSYQARAVVQQSEADRFESLADASRVARDKFSEEASDARQCSRK